MHTVFPAQECNVRGLPRKNEVHTLQKLLQLLLTACIFLQETSKGVGPTLERKPSKEEIVTFASQKLGVKSVEDAPIAFTSEADTLVS